MSHPKPPTGHGLRVCHLGKFYHPASGGVETHVRTLALAQAALGAQVQVICFNHADRNGKDVSWRKLAWTRPVEDRDGLVQVTRCGRVASIARMELGLSLPRILWGLRKDPVDILHLHVPNPTMLLALLAFGKRYPLVITYHSDIIRQRKLGALLRPFEHRVFRRAGRILCSSPTYSTGSELLRHYQPKLQVVPFGIDLEPYLRPNVRVLAHARDFREQYGGPLWLSVGRLVYYKGLHNAIQALRLAPGKLLLVGEGPLKKDLTRLAEDTGVADRVVWLGQITTEQLIGAYHAATALWFPSNARSEAFGFVQVEAMACGCPVINTAIPASGVSWVSRDGETGLTVPVDDPIALAKAACRLAAEPELREELSRGARERACAEFDHRLMARRTLEVYRALLPSGGASAAPVSSSETVQPVSA